MKEKGGIRSQTLRVLNELCGGLSKPSKMPGTSYSIPTEYCNVGGQLRRVKDSVCFNCYAHHRGRYNFSNVQKAMERRYEAMMQNTAPDSEWELSMIELIRRAAEKGEPYHRWFDSGDIQGIENLEQIVRIARALPQVRFWLPTKEYALIRAYLRTHKLPKNLVIRVSNPMVNQYIGDFRTESMVVGADVLPPKKAHICPAPEQDHMCGDCRACWDPKVRLVAYRAH